MTGAAGGLGRATTEHLAARDGWQVVAADLPGDRLDALADLDGVTTLALDVTDPDSVAEAAARLPDGLDGVVTFAGVLRAGSLVDIPEDDLRLVMDVNVMGTYRVVRAVFDRVVARSGRIVVISSETGWQTPFPFNGPYAMSKHAVEAYADTIRREAALLGVTVVKIQPGPFRTDMVAGIEAAFTRAADQSTHFGPLLRRLGPQAARSAGRANDPELLARTVHAALTSDRPPIAYSVRPGRMRSMLEWLPDRLADRVVVGGLGRLYRRTSTPATTRGRR